MRESAFIGVLENQLEVRTTLKGTPVVNLELSVSERKGDGVDKHIFRVTVFGTAATRIYKQARIGSEIVAFCKPESREYKDSQGRTKRSEDHIANWIRVCVSEETEVDTYGD